MFSNSDFMFAVYILVASMCLIFVALMLLDFYTYRKNLRDRRKARDTRTTESPKVVQFDRREPKNAAYRELRTTLKKQIAEE